MGSLRLESRCAFKFLVEGSVVFSSVWFVAIFGYACFLSGDWSWCVFLGAFALFLSL